MRIPWSIQLILSSASLWLSSLAVVQLPPFETLKLYYPGYRHHGGRYGNRKLVRILGVRSQYLLHDTSALRLSYTFNKIGSVHSLGKVPISLSVHGKDSLPGRNGLQFIFHPISYGPYLADKYGYPTVSRVQTSDSLLAKIKFWGLQGVVRVLTYTKVGNHPKGHVALWDCDHFYQTKDWMRGHTLLTVEFWKAPDSDCSRMSRTNKLSRTLRRLNTPISELIKRKSAKRRLGPDGPMSKRTNRKSHQEKYRLKKHRTRKHRKRMRKSRVNYLRNLGLINNDQITKSNSEESKYWKKRLHLRSNDSWRHNLQ